MSRIKILTLLLLGSIQLVFSQEQSIDKIQLNQLILDFEQSILTKDSTRFIKLFLDDQVKFTGIMSEETEMSIKKDYPEFEGVSVSTCSKFIHQICETVKLQKENFYDIIIDTDSAIGSVSFDYSYYSGDKMIQWGHEKWNVVKIGNEWLITDVVYSIHFPDIELFPYSRNLGKDSHSEFYSFDNTKISFTDEGRGEAVLLIHGFIVNGSSWNKSSLKNMLIDSGYRVVIPDLRGNGNSDKPQNENAYKNDAEIKDLIALADHLKLKSFKAVGYSRGSIVLAKLLTQEKRISKAVFGGMGIDFTDPNWDRRIAFADAFTGRSEPNEMTKGALDFAKSINADIKVLGYLQDQQPVTSISELNNIKIECLVIAGDQDLDNGHPKDLQKNLANSKLIIVEGDHNNTYKQNNFAQSVIDFL